MFKQGKDGRIQKLTQINLVLPAGSKILCMAYQRRLSLRKEQEMLDIAPLLRKGALIAQNPKDYENIPELDENDKEVIRRETTRLSQNIPQTIRRSRT
ncbi:hypothetical protein C0993_008594 [Termitomyces sp. T159_Od127]|nr:hypothetical protein C0993_008594 [Termitomyces sp. T159_Od127]